MCNFYKSTMYLKSNMDRFIEDIAAYADRIQKYLKSNMDRFIVVRKLKITLRKSKFKIQYG